MSARPLAVFDVDGTLVDSRETIHGAITHGFRRAGREPPVGSGFQDATDRHGKYFRAPVTLT